MTVAANPYFQNLPSARRQELMILDQVEPGNLLDEIDLLRIVTAQALKRIYDLRELDPRRCRMQEVEVILQTIPVIIRILNTICFVASSNQANQVEDSNSGPDEAIRSDSFRTAGRGEAPASIT